jgi:hypothetical protein
MNPESLLLMREKLSKVLSQYHDEKEPDDSIIIFERVSPNTAVCLLGARIPPEPPVFGII